MRMTMASLSFLLPPASNRSIFQCTWYSTGDTSRPHTSHVPTRTTPKQENRITLPSHWLSGWLQLLACLLCFHLYCCFREVVRLILHPVVYLSIHFQQLLIIWVITSKTGKLRKRLPSIFRTFLSREFPAFTTLAGFWPNPLSFSALWISLLPGTAKLALIPFVGWTPEDLSSVHPLPWRSKSRSS